MRRVVQTYAKFDSKIPSLIRKHFIAGSAKKIDFSWVADVKTFLSKLQIVFENYISRDNNNNCNIGQKYLNYASKAFKKNYYKDRHGISSYIQKEDLTDKKYLFQEDVDKQGFYELVKNRQNKIEIDNEGMCSRILLNTTQMKYFNQLYYPKLQP